MSCTICGKATGPGALLCRPCKAALKRARQFTVLEMPGTPPAVTLPMDSRVREAPRVRKAAPRSFTPGSKSLMALAVLFAVVAIGWYLAQRLARADDVTFLPAPMTRQLAPKAAQA